MQVNTHDDDGHNDQAQGTPVEVRSITSSPPPYSRSPSPERRRLLFEADPLPNDADHTLEDAFDNGSDSDDDDEPDDRQRLMRGTPSQTDSNVQSSSSSSSSSESQQRPTPSSSVRPTRSIGMGRTNDGVFANLNAKPERAGEKPEEDLPPSYEQAAADATPPYWETTILAPGMASDEVYVDGLPVGSVFSFIWNGMISMSFQLIGFLLTYLLHTTHAAKNGSKAGLGLTLVQYGFYMKGSSDSGPAGGGEQYAPPSDPNSHDFDPNAVGDQGGGQRSGGSSSGISTGDWVSYILMIVGWFILIRSVCEFIRVRRHEQLVLQSPARGLPTPVIAEGERSETVV